MSQQSAISAKDPLQCCCLSNCTQKERQGCYQGRDTHHKTEPPQYTLSIGGYARDVQRRDRSQAPCGRLIGAQDSWNSKVGQYRTPCSTELWTCRMQGAISLPQVPWLQLRPPSWPFVAQDQHLPASLTHMRLLVLPRVPQALSSPRRQVALWVSLSYAECTQP